ncbi:hypothetical protein Leryth_027647 [Lithospermum erythrorhizon]|nr:hypothetical protein Leryth_027647 [Lithospermum erythrorhizon]
METSTSTSTSHEGTKRGKAMKSDTPIQRQLLIPSLPDELSLEILTRIPIKPLIRFTIVSKPWNLLITSPHFTKSHLSTSLSNPLHSHHYLLHSSARPNFTLHQTPLNPILPNIIEQQQMVLESHSINHPMQRPDESLWLVGSINGLVCLALDENEIIFWNPCLGKHRRVPRLEVKIKRGCFILYGFGYDAVGEDYKVVSIFCVFKESNVYENEVMVYSGKSDSWKTIEGFKDGVPLNDSGKFVNGKLHWATSPGFHSTNGGKSKWSIVSIDVGDESWGELDQLPLWGRGKYDGMGARGDCACNMARVADAAAKAFGERVMDKDIRLKLFLSKISNLSTGLGDKFPF